MKQLFMTPVLVLALATPTLAEDKDDGFSLMEEGAKLFFRGIMKEVEPAMTELEGFLSEMEPALRSFATEMGPAFRGLMEKVDDWTLYDAPEVLPNGDIIIRRKPDAKPYVDREIDI